MKSSTLDPLPSRCAAIVINAPTVMTPVPPTPVTSRSNGFCNFGKAGGVMSDSSASISTSAPVFLRRTAPSRVTKLGQKPFRQEKSLLQLDRLILRLRPSSVSSGSMLRQLLSSEQSPQPSQTAGLIKAKRFGSSIWPRLRRRRFSVAQVCS